MDGDPDAPYQEFYLKKYNLLFSPLARTSDATLTLKLYTDAAPVAGYSRERVE